MKIFYYNWQGFAQLDMIEVLRRMGHMVVLTTYYSTDYEKDAEFEKKITIDLEKDNYDFMFSFNYFPVISNVCERMKIKYIAWIYDSPCMTIFSDTILNSCNVIFHFDRFYSDWFTKHGFLNVYHMPLAANMERFEKIRCTKEEEKLYCSDITFVGSLYEKRNLYDQIKALPSYLRGYFEGVMNSQMLVYGYNFLEEILTEDILHEVKKYVKLDLGSFFFNDQFIFANLFLGQKVTSMERIMLINLLSQSNDIMVYTETEKGIRNRVHYKGTIDSEVNAHKVYQKSKINLNITLKSIRTGIPLRVFDILGSSGFLISNYQEELLEYFTPEEEIIIYESAEDLKQKVSYYLDHEERRREVALCAYQKMKEYHTFEKRIDKIMDIAWNDK